MKLTKKVALRIFKDVLNSDYVYYAHIRGDKVAMRESWNNFTDGLCKDGEITESQYNNWSNPFQRVDKPARIWQNSSIERITERTLNMTIIKKTSVVEWATQEVGVACDMVSQTTLEEFNLETGESLGEYKFEPVVVAQLAEGWQ